MANAKESTDIIIPDRIDKEKVISQIHEIRGIRVMLDSDIAVYFGVETKALNRSMKRNIQRFPDNFCFQISRDEYTNILRCQSGTLELGQGKYSKYLPYVYSEQGVAMLTSCLHTPRAIAASIQIMEAFVEMKHYLQQNQQLLPYKEMHLLSNRQDALEQDVKTIKETMVTKADLTDLMRFFESSISNDEILILNSQPFTADMAYQKIYRKAKKNVIVIDDYIGIKTLHHLTHTKNNTEIIIITDNRGQHSLRKAEYEDYITEYPGKEISFIKANKKVHDRFIILDYATKDMKVYLCGSSSKDAGKRITTITEIKDIKKYKDMVEKLLNNPMLKLK